MRRAFSRIVLPCCLAGSASFACSGSSGDDAGVSSGGANAGRTGGAGDGGSAVSDGGASGSGSGGGGASNVGGSGGRSSGGATASGTGGRAAGGSGGVTSGGVTSGGVASGGVASGGVASGGVANGCKKGVAANTPPAAAFFPALAWWYNWSPKRSGADVGIEFTPMVWGSADMNAALPAGSKYLLTFNEPNFHAQSNLTAAQAAGYWPMLEAKASALNIPLVSPAMNFCGPAASCNGTDPYQYLKDFFAACPGCKVDYVAVHWYNCDLPSLKDYLEPGGNLQGFEQFGKPIWLTEFSCGSSATVAAQEAYMRAALPYLNGNPHVFRYSWFSADPIPNAKLINADGSPTSLGQVYIGLPDACR